MAALLLGACAAPRVRVSDPLSPEEHNDLGVAYQAAGEYRLAVREFRRALELRPGWTRALANLGDALLADDDLELALTAYARAYAARPDDPAIANNYAWALLQHDVRWPEAEPIITGALARSPEPRGYYLDTLGLLLLRRNEPDRAREAFRSALADPALTAPGARALVLEHLTLALARLGDAEGAERCRRAARALVPPRPGSDDRRPASGHGLPEPSIGGSDGVC